MEQPCLTGAGSSPSALLELEPVKNVIDTTVVDYAPLEPLLRLGVDEIYCVHAPLMSLPSPEQPRDFDDAGFLNILRRAERMRSATAALTSVDPFFHWRLQDAAQTPMGSLPARVRHVVPTMALPLLNAFDYEPGLAAIWQDYSHMRAFDVLAPQRIFPVELERADRERRDLRNPLAGLSDLITATREMFWHL